MSLGGENAKPHQATDEHGNYEEGIEDPEAPTTTGEMVPYISQTLEEINNAFDAFDECSEYFINLPSQNETSKQDADVLSRDIKLQEQNQTKVFIQIKSKMEEDVRKQALAEMRGEISALIREEAVKQVKEQVDAQIPEHMPVSLQEQAEESKRQLQDIKISLENSQSRMNNSFIQIMNLDDRLAPILTPSGEKSPLYPSNVKSLFSYDLDSAKALSKDYGLAASDDLHENLRQILKHIGTSVDIVEPSVI